MFPALSLNPKWFLWSRVRELTGFSVYVSIIDWANRLNYSIDAIIIGAYMGAAAVALWTVPQRLAELTQRLTNQFNGVIFPVIVDSDAGQRPDRLRIIFIQGTRFSLATVIPLAAAMFLLARPLILAWVGPEVRRQHRRHAGADLRGRDPRRQRDARPACSRAQANIGSSPSRTPARRWRTSASAC